MLVFKNQKHEYPQGINNLVSIIGQYFSYLEIIRGIKEDYKRRYQKAWSVMTLETIGKAIERLGSHYRECREGKDKMRKRARRFCE